MFCRFWVSHRTKNILNVKKKVVGMELVGDARQIKWRTNSGQVRLHVSNCFLFHLISVKKSNPSGTQIRLSFKCAHAKRSVRSCEFRFSLLSTPSYTSTLIHFFHFNGFYHFFPRIASLYTNSNCLCEPHLGLVCLLKSKQNIC